MVTERPAPRVGVMGCGTMGAGIAVVAATAGCPTTVHEVSDEGLAAGRSRLTAFLDGSVRRGKLSEANQAAILGRLGWTTDPGSLAPCDVIIEAVPEDLDTKGQVFAQLHKLCPPETIFATNTSTLSVTAIAARSGRPDRVVGTHFCNPAPLMRLVEVVPGLETSPATRQFALDFVHRLGKVPVLTRDTPGFIVNFFLVPFENDCVRALEQGLATAEEIDRAVKLGLGYPMGTFELLDVVGLDIHHQVSMSLYRQLKDPRFAPPRLVEQMLAAGRLGRKTGRGFYNYESNTVFGA